MTKFKDALDGLEENGMGALTEYLHADTIRLALKIADAVTGETSDDMWNAGYDVSKQPDGTYIAPDKIFRAMIEQMMREIESEN